MTTERYEPSLPLDKIVIGKSQVRMRIEENDLIELANSIKVQGLIEPIIVFETQTPPGHYEVIAGQRRFLASQRIGAPTIKAFVVDPPADVADAKALSLTENMVRSDPSRADTIDACTELYYKYGSVKLVAERTGLPENKVREYVKTARLIPSLQEMVKHEGVAVTTALRAQDAATDSSGHVNEEEAVLLAKELDTMSGVLQKKVVQRRQENPDADVDEVIEDAKTGGRVVQILVTMSGDAHTALKDFAKREGTTLDDAARMLIESGLAGNGPEND